MGSANQTNKDKSAAVWMGESISKSTGLDWPERGEHDRPLAHSVNFKLNLIVHLVNKKKFNVSSSKTYMTASQNLIIQTLSAKLLDQPLPFKKARLLAMEFAEKIEFLDSSFKQKIKNWAPRTKPRKSDSISKLEVFRRTAYAMADIDDKIVFKLGLEEESTDHWQINLTLKRKPNSENKNLSEKISEFENLGAELKIFLTNLADSDRNKVPKEYQTHLIWYIDNLENFPRSVGGWSIEKSGEKLKLSRWHIVSDQRRVAASVLAEKIGKKWKFTELSFVIAKSNFRK